MAAINLISPVDSEGLKSDTWLEAFLFQENQDLFDVD